MASIINATTTNGVAVQGDNSGSLQLQTNNGTTAVTIDTSQNVGVGSASLGNKFEVAGSGMFSGAVTTNTTGTHISYQSGNSQIGAWGPDTSTNGTLVFFSARSNGVNGLERMRIDSSGSLLLGVSSSPLTSSMVMYFDGGSRQGLTIKNTANSASGAAVRFMDYLGNVSGGGIFYTSSNSITYATSSDYRLKENIAPMTGALEKVTQLKPCTFQWATDGSDGQGFIAHELQEVIPNAVVGEKDAVDAEGNPRYQGVDTSFLVATLTAAIQELKTELDATKAEVQALKGVA